MVLVPSDDDYKARCKAQEDAGCKDIPEDAIMEMKGNCNVTVQRMAPKLFKSRQRKYLLSSGKNEITCKPYDLVAGR